MNDQDLEKARQRIAKLENLAANNPSREEAMSAAEMAGQLRRKYGIFKSCACETKKEPVRPAQMWNDRYVIPDLTMDEMRFYIDCARRTAAKSTYDSCLEIRWEAYIEERTFFFIKRRKGTLCLYFRAGSKNSLEWAKRWFENLAEE